ncbi:Predicted oxidoreductase [Phaffia rhodozyma]|uniref:Predicted oxidoreductase n=1 Tax=Phaffia rhodozyma TaxID=264483 RepID=A0A0F7SIY2_PHARH|nr:Predicted oxidoreductase [Phaffia rhodozyma]
MAQQRLLVVGGNGFLGSAVCRAAISRGWDVHSLSTSARAPKMPDGETPAWTNKVTYHKGSAFEPSTFSHLLPSTTAVVHTMGILLEGDYKSLVNETSLGGMAARLIGSDRFFNGNPLKPGSNNKTGGGYEAMNRDSAISVLDALLASRAAESISPSSSSPSSVSRMTPTVFTYISAEDIFRPFVPDKYINTKREAELLINHYLSAQTNEVDADKVKGLIVRPGVMTHPSLRPLLMPLAPLLALSASIPPVLPNILRAMSRRSNSIRSEDGSSLDSMARLLESRTIDVDDVGEAVCVGIENQLEGTLGLENLRAMAQVSTF